MRKTGINGNRQESLRAGAVRERIKQSPCPLRMQYEGIHGNKEALAQNVATALVDHA